MLPKLMLGLQKPAVVVAMASGSAASEHRQHFYSMMAVACVGLVFCCTVAEAAETPQIVAAAAVVDSTASLNQPARMLDL